MTAEMLEESFMAEAYIVAAARTAGGRRGGRLSGWHPADLAAQVIDALLERTSADPALVDDVIMGCVLQAGEQSGCIGRMAVLASKLPKAVPGVTIDRQCGSSQQALHFAAQAVMSGTMDCVIAAGVESMSRIPMMALSKIYKEAGLGHYMSPTIRARYPGPEFSQFMGAEMMAEKYQLSRDALDRYSLQSHQRAAAATRDGAFTAEIVPVAVRAAERPAVDAMHVADEGIRVDATLEGIAGVKLLREGGRITAASASQICDGASGVLVVNERGLKRWASTPLARIHHMTVIGGDPVIMLEAPLPATHHALKKAGMTDRRHRPLRGERGLRLGPGGLAAGHRRRPGAAERQRRRDRAGPPARRVGHQADDDAGACAAGTRQALWPADDVRRRRPGQRDDRRAAVAARRVRRHCPLTIFTLLMNI